jgi:chromosome segregation ATPase
MTWLPVLLTVVGALVGSGGIVFGALRFNRDETGKTVTQHSAILADMESVNQHLISELDRLRRQLDELRAEHETLLEDRARLRRLVGEHVEDITALKRKVASLEKTIEEIHSKNQELESLIAQLRGAK